MKRALITGASSGIGEAFAHLLASKNIELILSGRNEDRLLQVAQKVGVKETIVADLMTEEGRRKVIEAIRQFLPDLIVNNAGFGLYGEAITISTEAQVEILEVNARVPLECTLEAAKALIQANREGIILNVSSVAGDIPMPGMSVYGASKAFVTMFSRALNFELASKGIHVLVSCPGMVATEFANRAGRKRKIRSGKIMSAEFAANEMWKQVTRRQEKRTFNLYYRIVSWISSHLVPLSFVKKKVWKSIQDRI